MTPLVRAFASDERKATTIGRGDLAIVLFGAILTRD